jgi:serine/threonine protein phosphatase PrpC
MRIPNFGKEGRGAPAEAVDMRPSEAEKKPRDNQETEKKTEKEGPFVLEIAAGMIEKAPGKGEDRMTKYSDGKKTFVGVYDGMGGQEGGGGDVAAQIVAEEMQKLICLNKNFPKDQAGVEALMTSAAFQAHEALRNSPLTSFHPEMGTTMASMVMYGDKATVATSGDSNIYRLRDGKLEMVSSEDSVLGRLKAAGYEISTAVLSEISSDGTARDVTLNQAVEHAEKRGNVQANDKYSEKYIQFLLRSYGDTPLKSLRNTVLDGMAAKPHVSEEIRKLEATLPALEKKLVEAKDEGEKSKIARQLNVTKKMIESDTPEWAPHVFTIDVQDGDEFVVTSDGLTDNVDIATLQAGLNNKKITTDANGETSSVDYTVAEKTEALKNYAKRMQNKKINPDANKPDDISIIYVKAEKPETEIELDEEDVEEVSEETEETELTDADVEEVE